MTASQNPVVRWFGPRFQDLHPGLQALHQHGGTLAEPIEIRRGRGLAGQAGLRLARKLGVPTTPEPHRLKVDIRHDGTILYWYRRFDDASRMDSHFEPVGCWPQGYWRERTGAIELELAVDVIDGGWHWRCRRVRWHGIPLPMALLPRTRASKRIEDGRYRFEVAFALPWLGEVLSYRGLLELQSNDDPTHPRHDDFGVAARAIQ